MIIYNKYNNTVKVVKRYEGDAEHIKNDLIDIFYSYDTGYIDHMGTISEFENYTRLIQDQQWNSNLNKDFNYDHYNGYFLNEYGEDATYDHYNGFYKGEFKEVVYSSHSNDEFFTYNREYREYGLSSGELIYITYDERHYYFNLDEKYELHSCDNCESNFLTHYKQKENFLKNKISVISKVLRERDLCLTCYERLRKEEQVKNGKRAMNILYQNGKIPASSQQRYLCDLLEGELNYRIGRYFVDILIDDKIVIEYDGSGHWLQSRYGDKTVEEIDEGDIKRDKDIIDRGYKVIRIVSKEDLLPSDEVIKSLVSDAIKNMKQNKRNKIVIKIDRNNYSDNELRTIKVREVVKKWVN